MLSPTRKCKRGLMEVAFCRCEQFLGFWLSSLSCCDGWEGLRTSYVLLSEHCHWRLLCACNLLVGKDAMYSAIPFELHWSDDHVITLLTYLYNFKR